MPKKMGYAKKGGAKYGTGSGRSPGTPRKNASRPKPKRRATNSRGRKAVTNRR